MKKKFLVLLIVLIILSGGLFVWWQQALKPTDPTVTTTLIFTISRGESARAIADRLKKQGLIRSPVAFFVLARFGGLADKLQAGDFRLSPSMDLHTISETLTHGTTDVWIVIPEGWRKEEISLKLAKELSVPESSFLKDAKEGYMFPDTYLVPKDATPDAIITLFQNNFNNKFTQDRKEKAQKLGLSVNDILTVASLVEREAKLTEDRPLVASVILNRLAIGMKLDIDATVQYILGYQAKEKTWWKKDLTQEDLATLSPYNTYLNVGLPPTPIANPGLAAIDAVLNAPKTDYLYYVSDSNGRNHYAKTIEEHNANIAKYLNK